VQACGDCQSGGRNCGNCLPRGVFALRFQHRLRHFLDEERNAVGALDDVLSDARRQQLVPGDAVDDGSDLALAEPVEDECRGLRPSNPRRLKFRSVRYDQQYAQSSYTVYRSTEGFQAGWISPVGILKNHQYGLLVA